MSKAHMASGSDCKPHGGTPKSIGIIGAGAAGLSAARHLVEAGHDVQVFEAGSYVGGLWVYDNDNGLGVAYESLHINSEPRATAFHGYPFPSGTPLFPSHRQVAAYLNAFADDFDLRRRIRFNSRVADVRRDGDDWTITLADGSSYRFEAVVVASGHQGVPADPEWSASFEGEYLHSHAYRTPHQFEGKRVLVVGVGNSGLDIAADVTPFAAETYSSARSPVLIMPRMILGVPSARIISLVGRPWLPWVAQRSLLRAISRIYNGRMEQWGFVTPNTRTHPASNATYMAHVSYHKIGVKPGVSGVTGKTVEFVDGTSIEVDTVIAATGYHIDLPFLAVGLAPVQERRLEAYRRIVHPDQPGLYFIGFFNVSGGANISMMDVQSSFLTAVVDGTLPLPSPAQMKADIVAERRFLERRYPSAARYGLELVPQRYRKQISDDLRRVGAGLA